MKKVVLPVLVVAVLAACSARKTESAAPAKAPVETVALDPALLTGKTLYETHCGGCHPLKKAEGRTKEAWTSVVPRMVVKVNKKAGKEVLGEAEKTQILNYLHAVAKKS